MLQEMKLSILTIMKVVIVSIKVKYGGVKQVNGVVKQSTMQQNFQNNLKWNHKNKIAKIENKNRSITLFIETWLELGRKGIIVSLIFFPKYKQYLYVNKVHDKQYHHS